MKFIGLLGTAALLAGVGTSASAATTVNTSHCISVSNANGCLFNGNINNNTGNPNSYLHAQNAYNAWTNPDITLNPIVQSSGNSIGGFGTISGHNATTGTWSLPGWNVQYIAVKASNEFVIYEVSGSSGNWATFQLRHGMSHLSFFGQQIAVPEPGAWALLILGFGALGATLRRRRPAQEKLHFA